MLNSILLKFTERLDPLQIPADGVTIFVGPNNSGKSLVLRELEQDFSSRSSINAKILGGYELDWPTKFDIEIDIDALKKIAPPGTSPDNIYVGRFSPDGNLEANIVQRNVLFQFIEQKINGRWLSSEFLRFFLIRLDGRTRFALTNDRARGDLLGQAQNILMHLFMDTKARKKVRDIIFDAFGQYFTIEQLSAEHLRIRLSQTEPDADEQNWNEAARKYHGSAIHIKDASDGVQAFVGILCAVLSGDYKTILIDEPEAFLHPPLARKLGYQLATNLRAGGTLMASTHSPDFLMGCLQASPNVRVVRLEYSDGKSKGQIVDSTALRKFFRNPLIRSANVISALFHDGVVVTESDNDRAFYSEVYYRLSEHEKGYPSLLFVNAQNKQTIQEIVGPLRAFGVPAAAIVDIDILKDGGSTWTGWLQSAQVPTRLHGGLGQIRGDLKKAFEEQKINMKADGGVEALADEEKDAANELFDTLNNYGVFVTRKGELEHWLKDLNVPGKKTDWTIAMLERLGADPNENSYVRPTAGDVWDFMRSIAQWVKNPARKGTA